MDEDSQDEYPDAVPAALEDEVVEDVEVRERAWAPPVATGVPTVDAVIGELDRLDALPTSEHVTVYDAVHRQLQDALADLDGA